MPQSFKDDTIHDTPLAASGARQAADPADAVATGPRQVLAGRYELLGLVGIGGMGSVWGVIVGGVVLGWLNIEGLAVIGSKFNDVSGLDIEVPKYQFGIYGIIIVLMMLFRPQGLIPERRRKRELEEGVHDQPLYDERVADEPGSGERA